jgi:hypothetical protein
MNEFTHATFLSLRFHHTETGKSSYPSRYVLSQMMPLFVLMDSQHMANFLNRTAMGAQSFVANSVENFLATEVPFDGVCPALPANRDPSVGVGTPAAANDGWELVDFCIDVGSNTAHDLAVAPDCHNNDDDSSVESLMFDFDMYGTTFKEVFINTNGHLTFGGFYSFFTPAGIPFAGVKMVAPFWADIDIGNVGYIWKKAIGTNTFAVAWDHVGYYDEKMDKKNTFSLMISDGTNPDFGTDDNGRPNNVCFCYHQMEWTTGDVSGGLGGFGGTSSTIGINNGDGTNWLDLGGYNDASVSTLDGTSTCFRIPDSTEENVNPVPVGLPANGEIVASCNSTITKVIEFVAPEADQNTFLTVGGAESVAGLNVTIEDGDQTAAATINWTPVNPGPYVIPLVFTATDTPGGQTVVQVLLKYNGCSDGGNTGGDPHFTTWSGEKFDFHGECDMVLVSNPDFADGLGMHIHGRTKIHHDWSAFESAAIKIGDDIFEVKGKTHWWNGEENAELPVFIGGYMVDRPTVSAHAARYVVHLGDGERIYLKSYDEFLWVGVEGPKSKDFANTVGLLGTYGGVKLARNGLDEMTDTNAFGQEWQVRYDQDPQLFHTREGPQWPNKCVMPAAPKPEGRVARHLRMSVAKEACSHVSKASYDDCVADVVATNNADLAQAY